MTLQFNTRHKVALLLAHVAGMIDLVALPLWVGAALIGYYKFSPQQAGILATSYLVSVAFSSLVIAPRMSAYLPYKVVACAFAVAAFICLGLAQVSGFASMLCLHIAIGLAVGVGLSTTHGVIGRSHNPHRLFAFVGTGLGVFAVLFISSMAVLLPKLGGAALFYGFACMMGLASLSAIVIFPRFLETPGAHIAEGEGRLPVPPGVWWVVGAISLMVLTQATMASFFERIGVDHGFGKTVLVVLAATLPVTILPPILAGLLQGKWSAQKVMLLGPLVQAGLALMIVMTTGLLPYIFAVPLFISSLIFTHTFGFGWLARLDASGSVAALTPAMLMAGSAVGPALGGFLVQQFGYGALGGACLLISSLSALCSWRAASVTRAVQHASSQSAAYSGSGH